MVPYMLTRQEVLKPKILKVCCKYSRIWCTVAGMVAGLELGLSLEEAFCQAVASGTATAFDDLALEDIEKSSHKLQFLYLMGSDRDENNRITY